MSFTAHSLPNKKVSGSKDHGKNYIKVRPGKRSGGSAMSEICRTL